MLIRRENGCGPHERDLARMAYGPFRHDGRDSRSFGLKGCQGRLSFSARMISLNTRRTIQRRFYFLKMMDSRDILLEMRGIVKDFSGQRALDHVDFDVCRGEVHALVGENGAGKSTLIKIIAGVYRADQGEIFVDGERRYILDPGESQTLGLAFIHQDLNIVPHLSVAENIFLGYYPRNRLGLVRLSKMVKAAQQIPEALRINADLRSPGREIERRRAVEDGHKPGPGVKV